ncbi:serine/threonine-protein kinase 11-interacting protein-like isoform X2 [Lineus longissimus]|uniref:serine/threonine-protein kinase 11-interacting protein-like isoform X2 n=1 Tax=Lineus longissimus TaxID=88925 RepID=UPI00315CFAEF
MCGDRAGYSRLIRRHRMARHEKEVIRELTHLIHTKGNSILSGTCKLSLTSVSLSILNERFKQLPEYDGSSNSQNTARTGMADSMEDIKYLFDFLQKITSLKVIHGSSTIQGQVRLHQFKNLQCLEVKKVPVHLLEGLHHLRATLRTLITSRCLQNLQDLFESCGGDMSSAQSWPLLKTVCLSSNNLEVLDGSLRLVPSLQVLDLSFNQMTATDEYLEYPTELLHVNLAFNRLEAIPTFALRVQHQLQTLILRNNNLDNINGIEVLGELHELDISHNCFSDHDKLHLLCYLHKLKNLNLSGNPLCYHTHHRRLAVQFLSPIAAQEILVDGKPVSSVEALYIPKNPVHYRKGSLVPSAFADIHSRVNRQLRSSARNSPNIQEESEGETSTSVSSRGKKSKKKARRAVISDFESSTDYSSRETSRATTPRSPYSEPQSDASSIKNGSDGALTREEIATTRKQLGPGWLVSLTARQDHYQEQKQENSFEGPVQNGKTHDDYFLNDDMTTPTLPQTDEDDGIVVILPNEGVHAVPEKNDVDAVPSGLRMQRSTSSGMAWDDGGEEAEEEPTEGEPFIINLNDEENTQIIVILGDRFLWEKGITGDVLEKLDLKLLLTIEKCETNGSDFAVKLTFEYLRRDRQGRLYLLENEEQQALFCQHLDGHLEAKQEANKHKDMLHCLKCEAQFHKSLSIMGTDEFEFHEDGKVKDSGYKCPQCQSTMVVELDAKQVAQSRGVGMETPVGSLKSLDAKLPLAASSNHTSPVKIGQDITDDSRDTDSFKSCAGTYSSFKSVGDTTPSLPSPKTDTDTDTSTPKYVTADSSLDGRSPNFSNSLQEAAGRVVNSVQYVNKSDSKQTLPRNKAVPTSLTLTKSDSEIGSSPRQIGPGHGSSYCRNRIDSEESDITVISNPSQSSIAVLTNPSQNLDINGTLTEPYNSGIQKAMTMSPVSGRSLSMDAGADLMKNFGDERKADKSGDEIDGDVRTPHGSLTTRAVSSMIDSVYEFSKRSTPDAVSNRSGQASDNVSRTSGDENTYGAALPSGFPRDYMSINSNHNPASLDGSSFTSYIAGDSTDSSLTKQVAAGTIVYNYEDYSQIDHRLKLWLTMNLFEDNEECHALLRCGVVQYAISDEYPALLVTTDKTIYIIKIIGPEKDDPANWLKCTEQQPITELQYVDIGYNYQCFRLEFSTDFSSYTCVVRDEKRCKLFIATFTGVIQSGSLSTHSKLEGITKNFAETLENLREEVFLVSEPEDSFLEDDLEVRQFVAGYLHEDETKAEKSKTDSAEPSSKPVTIVTTKALICLANQNYQWPLPRLQGPLSEDVKKTEFSLIDKKHVNEIAQVNMYLDNPNLLTIEFFEDDSDTAELCCWEVTMETKESLDCLVESIKEPWEEAFSVPLTIVQLTCTMSPES